MCTTARGRGGCCLPAHSTTHPTWRSSESYVASSNSWARTARDWQWEWVSAVGLVGTLAKTSVATSQKQSSVAQLLPKFWASIA